MGGRLGRQEVREEMNKTMLRLVSVLALALALFVVPVEAAKKKESKAAEATEPLDLNTATQEQLEALGGIGKVYAAKIIQGRPYKRKDELKDKVLPAHVYEKIRELVIARQPDAKARKKGK